MDGTSVEFSEDDIINIMIQGSKADKVERFSRKAFLSWAVKKGLVETDSRGYPTKAKKLDGIVTKCVFLPA